MSNTNIEAADDSDSVTKIQITNRISTDSGLSGKDSAVVLGIVLDQITTALRGGGEVLVSGFGKFSVQSKGPRVGRNPRTNETVEISARKVMRFKPSKTLKVALNSALIGK